MEKKCGCGHVHCCHENVAKEEILDKNEGATPFYFEQETCADCHEHIKDTFLRFA